MILVKLLATAWATLIVAIASSQNIIVKVVSSETKPMENASVSLLHAGDSTLIKTASTNAPGIVVDNIAMNGKEFRTGFYRWESFTAFECRPWQSPPQPAKCPGRSHRTDHQSFGKV